MGEAGCISSLLILDRQTLAREALRNFIEARLPEIAVIACAETTELEGIGGEARDRVDLAIVNIGACLASDARVVSEVETLRGHFPGVPIVLLGELETEDQVVGAIRNGVQGYLPSSYDPAIVMHVLQLVRAGGTYLPVSIGDGRTGKSLHGATTAAPPAAPRPAQPLARLDGIAPPLPGAPALRPRTCASRFTPRERQVLTCLGRGMQNKLIAHELDLQESTVKVHVRNILKKLDVQSRTQAALYARDIAWPAPQPQPVEQPG